MKKFKEIISEVNEVSEMLRNGSFNDRLDEYDRLIIKKKILVHNAKVALFHWIAPIVLDVLKEYNGKRVGEKTRQKIKETFSQDIGVYFNFVGTGIEITTGGFFNNDYKIVIGKKDSKPLLNDNKIDVSNITAEDIGLWYINDEYIEFVDARIVELQAVKRRAIELQRELERTCSRYNELAPEGAESICYSKYIY